MTDPTFVLLLCTDLAFFLALMGGIRVFRAKERAIRAEATQMVAQTKAEFSELAKNGMKNLSGAVIQWAFTEGETEIPDPEHPGQTKKVKTRTPSPEFRGLVAIMVPELVGQAVQMFRDGKIKIGAQEGITALGAATGGVLPPEIVKQIPKEWRGAAQLAFQFKDQLIGLAKRFGGGKFGGGDAAGAGSKETVKYSNPFLKA